MKLPVHKVSPEHFEAFCGFVSKWQEMLNLGDWRIGPSQLPPSTKSCMAEIAKIDYESRTASIRLAGDFGVNTKVNDDTLEGLAVHEVLHVFLKELFVLAGDPNTPDDVTNSAEHRVINTLVRVLVPGKEI